MTDKQVYEHERLLDKIIRGTASKADLARCKELDDLAEAAGQGRHMELAQALSVKE